MTLDKVTSLADLVFKAKTNKYYKKLAIMTVEWLGYGNQTTYEIALNSLYKVAANQGDSGCQPVVNAINNLRRDVQEDLEPVASPIIDESIKKEKDEQLLKKKEEKKEEAEENVSDWRNWEPLPMWGENRWERDEYELYQRRRREQIEREQREWRWRYNAYGGTPW
jgi:hypothetical protein